MASGNDGARIVEAIKVLENEKADLKTKFTTMHTLMDLACTVDGKVYESLVRSLKLYVAHPSKSLRTASIRVMRVYLKDKIHINILVNYKLHYFIAKAVEKDKAQHPERFQAMKLIRNMINIDPFLVPRTIVQSLIAIAEHTEDMFARVAVDTICEIALHNPQIIAYSGGLKTLCKAVIDPILCYAESQESKTQDTIVTCILYLLDDASSRAFIRPTEIHLIFSPLLDTSNPLQENTSSTPSDPLLTLIERRKRWLTSMKSISCLLKTWTGLLVLAGDPHGLKVMVDALKLASPDLHEILLDGLYGIFRLPIPRVDFNPFEHNREKSGSILGSSHHSVESISGGQDLRSKTTERPNLVDNFLASLLIAFTNCGLMESLIILGQYDSWLKGEGIDNEEKSKRFTVANKATILLAELLNMSNTLLPRDQCARLQTLPGLVSNAVEFSSRVNVRTRASTLVTNLHSCFHSKERGVASGDHSANIRPSLVTGANKWRRVKGRDRRLDRIDDIRRKIDWNMDEKQLMSRLSQSGVLITKDHTKWSWNVVAEILEGPLRNPVLLQLALHKTKFIKRLLSFLRPSNHLFSTTSWTPENAKLVKIACQCLEVLLLSDQGYEYLKDNRLVKQIAELLRVEVEQKPSDRGNSKTVRLLSPERVLKTMAREYFTLLGTLSANVRGLEIMKQHKIFAYLSPMAELQGRDDLSSLILTSLDYNNAGHSRVLLSKSLTSPSKVVRFLATRHMRVLLRSGVANFFVWGVEFLVKQLSDSDAKVQQIALSVLDEACDDSHCLVSLLQKKPALLELGKPGKELLLRFLSVPAGFDYLYSETAFIKPELEIWLKSENLNYVKNVESALDESFATSVWREKTGDFHGGAISPVNIPPHLYGELVKTAEGCRLLTESKHFPQLIAALQNIRLPPIQRRAALWALGHIGGSPGGFDFLEKEKVLDYIVQLAEESSSMSIRGTCVYVLGIIAQHSKGKQRLEEKGWARADKKVTVCIPKNFMAENSVFNVPPVPYKGAWALDIPSGPPLTNFAKTDPQSDIITWIGNLSNHISSDSAMRNLKRVKVKHPEQFNNSALVADTLKLLESYKFKLQVRRFIYALCDDIKVDEKVFSGLPAPPKPGVAWVKGK